MSEIGLAPQTGSFDSSKHHSKNFLYQ